MDLLVRLWIGLATNLALVVAVIALLLVVQLGRRWASRRLGGPGPLAGLDTWLMVGAVIGARMVAALPDATLYGMDLLNLVRINQGLSLYGALGGGAVALAFYAWRHHNSILPLADALALFLPLGIALYRLGCLAYGFCGGKTAAFPLGVPLPGHVGTRYPSELLEGVLVLALFVVLFRLAQRSTQAGIVTGAFLLACPLLRAAVDLTRFPAGPWPWADPLVSLGVAVLGLAVLLVLLLRRRTEVPTTTSKGAAARPLPEE